MRNFVAFLSVLASVTFVFGQDQGIGEREQYKKTKVSSETLMGFGVDENGKALEIGSKKSTRLFDENGNMTSLIDYDAKSAPVSRTLLKYNKDNQIIAGIEYKGYEEQMLDKYTISYNSKGQKVKKNGVLESKKYEIQYRHDEKGNLIEKTKFNDKNEKVYQYNYTFKNALVLKETYWSPEMTLIKNFTYDELGNLIKEENNTDKFQGYTFVYEYDSLNNKTKETKFTIDNIPYEWFEYGYTDDKQIKTILKYNYLGKLSYTWRYFYDGKNNLEFVKIYESEDKDLVYVTQYVYRYFGGVNKP